jgi:hypothetical protein
MKNFVTFYLQIKFNVNFDPGEKGTSKISLCEKRVCRVANPDSGDVDCRRLRHFALE